MVSRQPLRKKIRQRGRHFLPRMIAAQFLQPGQNIDVRRHVDDDVLALAPIGRYLQDRRTAQPAMGEQQRLVETVLPQLTTASTETPDRSPNCASNVASNVNGTSAARGGTIARPNCSAIL